METWLIIASVALTGVVIACFPLLGAYGWGVQDERKRNKLAGQHADDTLYRLEEYLKRAAQSVNGDPDRGDYYDALMNTLDQLEELSKDEVTPYG